MVISDVVAAGMMMIGVREPVNIMEQQNEKMKQLSITEIINHRN